MRIAITGATGFVGRATVRAVVRKGHVPILLLRREAAEAEWRGLDRYVIGDIGDIRSGDMPSGLRCDAVIHLAAQVPTGGGDTAAAEAQLRRANVDGTQRALDLACAGGATRFVFMSSIKVNGERTPAGVKYLAHDDPAPEDAYGRSKRDAERLVQQRAAAVGLVATSLRPPVVVGRGAGGNLAAMMRLARLPVPLPLASIANRRSMVHVDNLADLAVHCCERAQLPPVALAGDGIAVSTADLVRAMAGAQGRRAMLWPCPPWVIRSAASIVRREAIASRLIEGLEIDLCETERQLDWTPPIPKERALADALAGMVEARGATPLS